MSGPDTGSTFAFVGSLNRRHRDFAAADGVGISVFRFDDRSGRFAPAGTVPDIDNPTFLLVDSGRARLYATSEVPEWNEGTVSAYAIDPRSGALTYINKQPTLGRAPCYLAFDAAGQHVIAVNYGAGSPDDPPARAVAILPLTREGGLGPAVDSLPVGCGAAGAGPFHPHSAIASPDGRFLLVADAGAGFISSHSFDRRTGAVEARPAARLSFGGGRAPRHLAFHPAGRVLYATDEAASCIAVVNHAEGGLTLIDRVSTLVHPDPQVVNYPADLAVSSDARHLYATNRGEDSIATFSIDGETGKLSLAYVTPTRGTPRSLTLDRSGGFLLVSHQTGHDIAALSIDAATGEPSFSEPGLKVGSPTCIRLAAL